MMAVVRFKIGFRLVLTGKVMRCHLHGMSIMHTEAYLGATALGESFRDDYSARPCWRWDKASNNLHWCSIGADLCAGFVRFEGLQCSAVTA